MELPEDWMASEKGNTWLCDDDGNHIAWLRAGSRYIEVSVTPGNSPGLWARVLSEAYGEKKIVQHINRSLSGWTVVRCNFDGVKTDDSGMVA